MGRSTRRRLAAVVLAILLAGCDGDDGGDAGTDPNAPVISSLSGAFQAGSCLLGGSTGTPRLLTLDYADADGNVSGGRLRVTATFRPDASSVTAEFGVPSDDVVVTGTVQGQVRLSACVLFGSFTELTEDVVLVDASDKKSNALSITSPRPAGAPEVSRSARGSAYGGSAR